MDHYGNCLSSFKHTESYLPQVAVISAILFTVYINDLPDFLSSDCLPKSTLFADDLVLWSSAPKIQQPLNNKLNDSLEMSFTIFNWCGKNSTIDNIDIPIFYSKQLFPRQFFNHGFTISVKHNTT